MERVRADRAADRRRWSAACNRQPPPSIDEMAARDCGACCWSAGEARALGRRDLARLVRWMPMSVADLVGEWFETDLLRAAIAAHAVFGNPAGPWSAGTARCSCSGSADDPHAGRQRRHGPRRARRAGRRARRRSRPKPGATVRTDARVTRITTRDGRVTGVVLDNGDEIAARAVVSADRSDSRRSLKLVDPVDLPPTFLERMRHYSRARRHREDQPGARRGAGLHRARRRRRAARAAACSSRPTSTISSARSTRRSTAQMSHEPWLEIAVPTHDRPRSRRRAST